ncbi:MAG: hypothetical protein ABIJ86_11645, partial [Spirochaetota bacterium]
MKKTTLTISGASAYSDAFIEDARNSGRTLLALQAEPDSRRSSNLVAVQAGRQPENQEPVQADLMDSQLYTKTDTLASPEHAWSMAEIQAEPEPTIQAWLEPEAQARADTETAVDEGATPVYEYTVISWYPGSFASTKAALIEAETALGGTVNEAILFIDPPSTGGKRLSDLSLGQIEAASATWITGYAQLLRELGRRFAE